CGPRQVDQALGVERTTIIDTHDGALAVVQVGDARPGRQGQRLVGCGQLVHVVGFAGRGAMAMELAAVPGGDAFLDITLCTVHYGIADTVNAIRTVVAVAAAWLMHGSGAGALQNGVAITGCGVVFLAVAITAGSAVVHRGNWCLAGAERQGDQQQPVFHFSAAWVVFTGLKASSSRISWYAAMAYSTL